MYTHNLQDNSAAQANEVTICSFQMTAGGMINTHIQAVAQSFWFRFQHQLCRNG